MGADQTDPAAPCPARAQVTRGPARGPQCDPLSGPDWLQLAHEPSDVLRWAKPGSFRQQRHQQRSRDRPARTFEQERRMSMGAHGLQDLLQTLIDGSCGGAG